MARGGSWGALAPISGNSAIHGALLAQGPEALRPRLTTGLPFNRLAGIFYISPARDAVGQRNWELVREFLTWGGNPVKA